MKIFFTALIKLYQKWISPCSPPRCRYYPTCSNYALQAIERFGAIRGLALAFWRILRCNPYSQGGFDPVPDHFTFQSGKLRKQREALRAQREAAQDYEEKFTDLSERDDGIT